MSKKLWGGRFKKKTDKLFAEFSKSIHYDYKLAEYDVLGSMIHVEVLAKAGFLSKSESNKLQTALEDICKLIKNNKFKFDKNCEDIHTNIQNLLEKKVGKLVLKLHAARSRNDQVVFATKFYSKMSIAKLLVDIQELVFQLVKTGKTNSNVIMPGFTHMQHAQAVWLKDYLGAYGEMFKRDIKRLNYIEENIEICLGAGALAGTPIDSSIYKEKVNEVIKDAKFDITFNIKAVSNSLDTVSDRDFVIEIISALSIAAMHLSRMAEDFIIWSTKEFGFIELDDAFATGSSLMPQKKNPDSLELIRGSCAKIYGNLVNTLVMMKGLPLTYNRDMQLDKEPLFNSFEVISDEIKILAGIIKIIKFNKKNIEAHLQDESLYATDLVYYLIKKGIPFTSAHEIIGKLIRYSIENNLLIKDMSQVMLNKFSLKLVKKDIVKFFDPKVSVKSRISVKRR
ncbi:MAG: argininosuccinate lyase [Candidatus Gygaella obscura]|nr:argininosuccinate lyase [Candidatus Gygaella obscura]